MFNEFQQNCSLYLEIQNMKCEKQLSSFGYNTWKNQYWSVYLKQMLYKLLYNCRDIWRTIQNTSLFFWLSIFYGTFAVNAMNLKKAASILSF